MNANRLIIEPFNTWWRQRGGHCEPNQLAVEAFNAGFRAAMKLQEIQRNAAAETAAEDRFMDAEATRVAGLNAIAEIRSQSIKGAKE